jgi:predicted permease
MPTAPRIVLRIALGAVRLVAHLVPAASREGWRQEWEGEVEHRWGRLEKRHELDFRHQMNLLYRVLGTVPDAAWLRRQFTADADVVHDLRQGSRVLRRDPGFAAAAVLLVGLGLGSSTAVFAVADMLLLRALPYRDAASIVTVWQTNPREDGGRDDVSPANFLDWRDRSRSFETLAAAVPSGYDYLEGPEPVTLRGIQVTEGFFEVFGVPALLGRTLITDDYRPDRRVLVLSHSVWVNRFGSDPGVVGRSLRLDDQSWTVVGVMPRDFDPGLLGNPGRPRGVFAPKRIAEHEHTVRGSAWWNAVGRLRPGVTREQAQAEMAAISRQLASEWPRTNNNVDAVLVPLRDHLAGGLKATLGILAGGVAVLLLITWANLAGLLLARNTRREREMAVRAALGGSQGRLVRQLLTENLVLALLGCGLSLLGAYWAIRGIVRLSPVDVPRLAEVSLDGRVLVFAFLLALITTVVAGLVPALRLAGPRRERTLRESRAGVGAARPHLQRALVVSQVALTLVLLAGASLLTQSLARLLRVNPGFTAHNVVALQVFTSDRQATPEKRVRFFAETLSRIEALPGVESAGAVSFMPFVDSAIDIRSLLAVHSGQAAEAGKEPVVHVSVATPGYFEAMKIPLLTGRLFGVHDGLLSRPVAVVSQSLARRFWRGQDPVGSRVSFRWDGQAMEADVVGVVGPVQHARLDRPPEPEMFVPHAQVPFGSMTYVVRTSREAGALARAVQERVWSVDSGQAFSRVDLLETLVARSAADRRFVSALLSAFAVMALVLSILGVYGLLSFMAAQRTGEIGVRMALGASARDILRLVASEGAVLVGGGVLLGLLGTLAFGRTVRFLLFETSPADPTTLGTMAALIATTALLACLLPARRASRVDPLVALRGE